MTTTVYEAVGGAPFFERLAEHFYAGVSTDHRLIGMYPEELEGPRERLAGFLIQYWGGPAHYSEQRGHPRLRMRHGPFAVGPIERDAWLEHMLAGLAALSPPPEVESAMVDYFRHAAQAMVNWDGVADPGDRLTGDGSPSFRGPSAT